MNSPAHKQNMKFVLVLVVKYRECQNLSVTQKWKRWKDEDFVATFEEEEVWRRRGHEQVKRDGTQ